MTAKATLARTAGLCYLIVAVCGGFSELYVRSGIAVSGDAGATAANIRAAATLFRIGFVSDLVNIVCFLVVALLLYALLGPVNKTVALAMVAFNAVSVAIMSVNMLNHLGALRAATTSDVLATWFLEMHKQGFHIAQIFFGLWLLPLGYLIFQSGFFPKALGVLVVAGGFGYVGDLVLIALDLESSAILVLPTLAEVSLLLWLLVKGVPSTTTKAV